ncbi:MAG: NADP-specific glutamate dehydrogenase [Firmicutes bacterium]|nr:NADP-specific glutamate dehydrogenase [Bacillota bacterium]
MSFDVAKFMENVKAKNPGEPEFHQAVEEVVLTLADYINANPKYADNKILERMVEPERVVMFRVPWVDDKGEIQVNRGYRVQMNSAIGPYKGGLRFHPSVTLGTLKFLAFEQVFKNSLTTLPMGGGKGGADFDGVGKSDNEVMRFCQSFMTELYRHIGPNLDVPAGDIGVGAREVAYMFGQYKRIANEFTGVLTGKGRSFGGSLIRPEATGYGVIYFAQAMLATKGDSLEGKTVVNSGGGNVGTFLIEKVNQLGGKVVTVGDPYGYVYDPDGIKGEKLEFLKPLWTVYRRPIKDFADKFGLEYREGRKPWEVPCDIACPTATQNELNEEDAKTLIKNGCKCIAEGSNMSSTKGAVDAILASKILYSPGKASNAGGVAVSGLEMSQNSMRYNWTSEEVDAKLQQIMSDIHETCREYGQEGDYCNYVKGANIGGFVKVADAMIAQGIV